MAFITMVKKLTRNGEPCVKCRDIEARMKREGVFDLVDRVVLAREAEPDSEGNRLAQIYGVERAPFFLVADQLGNVAVYTVYFEFSRRVLKPAKQAQQTVSREPLDTRQVA